MLTFSDQNKLKKKRKQDTKLLEITSLNDNTQDKVAHTIE